MGQRSQIYVRINKKLVVANYYGWNYGERMISRAKAIIEWLKEYVDHDYLSFFTAQNDSSYRTKLSRVCDTNFDMRDVAISCDIVKEHYEDFADSPFNKQVFDWQDNNDGQLFIDVDKNGIKYCFTKYTSHKKALSASQYMAWDSCGNWTVPTDYLSQEDIDLCKNNIKYIKENAELMSLDELKDFVNGDYEENPAF